MLKKILLPLTLTSFLFSQEVIHSSISTYYENKTFTNSTQKSDGVIYGLGLDLHHNSSEFKLAYEYGDTNTKQPPLTEDLRTDKLFFKYNYSLNDSFALNVNYINILNDNIAITDGGIAYGAGLSYNPSKKVETNFTQFYTHYDDFNVWQSDLKLEYKTKINGIKVGFISSTKYIKIDDINLNKFTKYAQDDYLTTGLKIHAHYNSYHFGMGAFYGKRAFAIMDDGFKLQHHAMEFNKTYAIGAGKSISDFVLRFQYIYQRAIELPSPKQNVVDVQNLRFIANYKF